METNEGTAIQIQLRLMRERSDEIHRMVEQLATAAREEDATEVDYQDIASGLGISIIKLKGVLGVHHLKLKRFT